MPNLPLLSVCLARGSGSAEGAALRFLEVAAHPPFFFFIVFFYARGLHLTWRQARSSLSSRPLSSTASESQRYSTILRILETLHGAGKPIEMVRRHCSEVLAYPSPGEGGNQRRTKPQRLRGRFLRSLSSTSSSSSSDADSGPLKAFSSCNSDIGSQLSFNTRRTGVQASKQPAHPRPTALARAPTPLPALYPSPARSRSPPGARTLPPRPEGARRRTSPRWARAQAASRHPAASTSCGLQRPLRPLASSWVLQNWYNGGCVLVAPKKKYFLLNRARGRLLVGEARAPTMAARPPITTPRTPNSAGMSSLRAAP